MKANVAVLAIVIVLTGSSALWADVDLQVTEVMFHSGHPVGYDPDPPDHNYWWELTNAGTSSVNLAGYSWDDRSAIHGVFVFPSIIVGPGESIIILEKDDASQVPDAAGFVSAWDVDSTSNVNGVQVLTSDLFGMTNFPGLGLGDQIHLFDPSNVLVDSTPVVNASPGVSFQFPPDGSTPTASVSGQLGAWQANLGDVGSPGVIPEPATLSLLALGGLTIVPRRRRKQSSRGK